MRPITLAVSPEDPQFAVALLKLVIELRRDHKAPLDLAMARALKGMRVDREAFRRYVLQNRDRYARAASPQPVRTLARAR